MTSFKRKRDGFLGAPNREVYTDCDTPPAKRPVISLSLSPSSSTCCNKDSPRSQKRRKRPSVLYKSKRSRSKSSSKLKSGETKHPASVEEKSNSIVTPKGKKTGIFKPSPLFNADVLVSSLNCDSKVSKNSQAKNLSSSLTCSSSLILKTPTHSTHTPPKSSLKKRTCTRSLKDSPLTPRVSFEHYVTVAEFSPDNSTSTEEGEYSDDQDSIEDLLSLAIEHHSKQ